VDIGFTYEMHPHIVCQLVVDYVLYIYL